MPCKPCHYQFFVYFFLFYINNSSNKPFVFIIFISVLHSHHFSKAQLILNFQLPHNHIFQIIITFLLSFMEVQEQVGRLKPSIVLCRAATLTVIGLSYGLLGAIIQYEIGQHLSWIQCASLAAKPGVATTIVESCYQHSLSLALSCGLTAVTLGNIFQLFWQDRSVGDPL